MRAKEFTFEAPIKPYKYTAMTLDRALATLNAHCTEAFAMINNPLWRGMRNHNEPIVLIDPSTGERESNNTTNYYTQLIDNNPYFANWPKRSKSLICSSGTNYAKGYAGGGWGTDTSGIYAIFPYDGVPIAVCPAQDMWETKVYIPELDMSFDGMSSMKDFNNWLEYTMKLPENYKEMIKTVNKPGWAKSVIDGVRDNFGEYAELSRKTREFISQPNGPKNFLSVIMDALAPENTEFELMTIQEYVAKKPHNQECWVGGPVVAIRKDIWQAFDDAASKGEAPAQTDARPASVNDKDARRSLRYRAEEDPIEKKEYFTPPKGLKATKPKAEPVKWGKVEFTPSPYGKGPEPDYYGPQENSDDKLLRQLEVDARQREKKGL